jgi:hypothetical protein
MITVLQDYLTLLHYLNLLLGSNFDFTGSLGSRTHTERSGCMPAPNTADTAEQRILFSNLVSATPTDG